MNVRNLIRNGQYVKDSGTHLSMEAYNDAAKKCFKEKYGNSCRSREPCRAWMTSCRIQTEPAQFFQRIMARTGWLKDTEKILRGKSSGENVPETRNPAGRTTYIYMLPHNNKECICL